MSAEDRERYLRTAPDLLGLYDALMTRHQFVLALARQVAEKHPETMTSHARDILAEFTGAAERDR